MAIGWDEGNPTDNSIVSQFPGNERAQRSVQASAWAIEHDDVEGRHSFIVGNTAARDAITTWTTGAIFINTSAGTGNTVIQTVVSVTASVPGWDETGRFTSADDAKLALLSALPTAATSAEASAGSETSLRSWSPIIIKAAVSANIPVATQAQQEAASDNTVAVTPGVAHNHPSAAKGWADWNSSGTEAASYNVSSVTDESGAGDYTINWNTDFSSGDYSVAGMPKDNDTNIVVSTKAAGTCRVLIRDGSNVPIDKSEQYIVAFGDQ